MLVNAWKFWTLHRNRQEAKRRRKLSAKPARRQLSLETLENRLTPASAGFLTTAPGVIGGNVFVDTNNNGVQDAIEQVVPGVTITLSGTTGQGKTVNVSTATDAKGHYNFFGVAPGRYNLTRGLVANFFDGQTVAGNLGGTVASNAISNISVAEGQAGANYNFAVRGLATASAAPARGAGAGGGPAAPRRRVRGRRRPRRGDASPAAARRG